MAYGFYNASYGSHNAGRQVSITDVATGLPALMLASPLGGVVSNTGLTKLDSIGNLSVCIDLERTWNVEVFEETFRDNSSVNLVRKITEAEILTIVGELGVTYVVESTNKTYYWDGHVLVPFTSGVQIQALNSLYSQQFSAFEYDVGGNLISYTRDGIPHTVTYIGDSQVIIANGTGTSRTVNLDTSGRVVSIL